MELKYVKNIQFTRLIKCDGQLKEFNFRKPNGRQEGPFTVDVIDAKANRIIFNMEKSDAHWFLYFVLWFTWNRKNRKCLSIGKSIG